MHLLTLVVFGLIWYVPNTLSFFLSIKKKSTVKKNKKCVLPSGAVDGLCIWQRGIRCLSHFSEVRVARLHVWDPGGSPDSAASRGGKRPVHAFYQRFVLVYERFNFISEIVKI
jgi:hypothetical protein